MTFAYHSALKAGRLEDAEPFSGVFKKHGDITMCWDVHSSAIPDEADAADIFYAEPAWPAGFKTFNERAQIRNERSYADYCAAMARLIAVGKPTVLFASKVMLKALPAPDMTVTADLNGNKADVGFWNGAFATGNTNHEIIANLAKQHEWVWDFCAGYGTTGRIFREEGGSFLLTDHNPFCIGYIKSWMEADG